MNDVFFRILNMSIISGLLVGVVFLLRFILRRVPKWVICILWAIVALRLIVPFSIESPISAVPGSLASGELVQEITGIGTDPATNSSDQTLPETVEKSDTQVLLPIDSDPEASPALPAQQPSLLSLLKDNLWLIWIIGVAIMLLYALISFIKLKVSLAASVQISRNSDHTRIYASDNISSPFLLGLIRPSIYVPSVVALDLSSESSPEMDFILKHENAHISRGDHIWKPLGFILLAINWFNPMIWLGYVLLCRDIEAACDEKVIKDLDESDRISYSRTLLSFSSPGRGISACPVAFGETGAKSRIKAVLNYKKPAFWIIIAAIVLCIAVGVFFLTVRPDIKNTGTENEVPIEAGSTYWKATVAATGNGEPSGSYHPMLHFQSFSGDTGSFLLTYDPLKSYLSVGTAEIRGDSVICKTDDGKYSYVFDADMTDSKVKLVYNQTASRAPSDFIPDGTEFECIGMGIEEDYSYIDKEDAGLIEQMQVIEQNSAPHISSEEDKFRERIRELIYAELAAREETKTASEEDDALIRGWTLVADNTSMLNEDDIGLQRWNYAAEHENWLSGLIPIAIIGSHNIGMGVDPSDTSEFAYLVFSPAKDEFQDGWGVVVLEVSDPMFTGYMYFDFLNPSIISDGVIVESDWEFGLNTTAVSQSQSEYLSSEELEKLSLSDEIAQAAFEHIKSALPETMYPVAMLAKQISGEIGYQILCATDASEGYGDIYLLSIKISVDGTASISSCNRLNMKFYTEKLNNPPVPNLTGS